MTRNLSLAVFHAPFQACSQKQQGPTLGGGVVVMPNSDSFNALPVLGIFVPSVASQIIFALSLQPRSSSHSGRVVTPLTPLLPQDLLQTRGFWMIPSGWSIFPGTGEELQEQEETSFMLFCPSEAAQCSISTRKDLVH